MKKYDLHSIKLSPFVYGLLFIFLSTMLLYLVMTPFAWMLERAMVPTGDPFSYAMNYFVTLDDSRNNYWYSIFQTLTSRQWYWLQKGLTAILSPFLFKEQYSISLINYFLFGLASIQLFRLAKVIFNSGFKGIFLSLTFWFFPFHYNFSFLSLYSLMLDNSFYLMSLSACCSLILFSLDPSKKRHSIISGIFLGLALWGRGNSLPHVLLVAAIPIAVIFYKLLISEPIIKRKIQINFLFFIGIFVFMTTWFYFFTLSAIIEYYSYLPQFSSGSFIERILSNLSQGTWIYKNVPGIFITKNPDGLETIICSFTIHFFIITTFGIVFFGKLRLEKKILNSLKIIILNSTFIYFSTYFGGIISVGTFVQQTPYHNFATMLVGLAISTVIFGALIILFVGTVKRQYWFSLKKTWVIFSLLLVILVYATQVARSQPLYTTPTGFPTPAQVRNFSLNLEQITQGKSVTFLWSNLYSPIIIDYYRLQEGIPSHNRFNGSYTPSWNVLPVPTIDEFRVAIRNALKEADFIVLPEIAENLSDIWPNTLWLYWREVVVAMNESNAPRFQIRMLLHDANDIRLLILQRLEQGELGNKELLLPLPYGEQPVPEEVIMSPFVLSDRAKIRPIDNTPPKLVEEGYKKFNIVTYKSKFYAIAQDFGSIDLSQVNPEILKECQLSNKCFIGSSLPEVKRWINKKAQ